VTGGKPIAVISQSISCVNAINPLVALYDIHGRKNNTSRVILLFCLGHHTRQNDLAMRNTADVTGKLIAV
jgi:hypothetical protein